MNLVYQGHSGLNVWLHLFMCGIGYLLLLFQALHHLNNGISVNLVLVILESGGVWHMFMFKRIKEHTLVLIMKSAYLLVMQMVTRHGSFTIQQLEKWLLVKGQTLMNAICTTTNHCQCHHHILKTLNQMVNLTALITLLNMDILNNIKSHHLLEICMKIKIIQLLVIKMIQKLVNLVLVLILQSLTIKINLSWHKAIKSSQTLIPLPVVMTNRNQNYLLLSEDPGVMLDLQENGGKLDNKHQPYLTLMMNLIKVQM